MSTREVGYWWVRASKDPEMIYWTGAEAQFFGTDAVCREHEIAEWISYEGTAPRVKATLPEGSTTDAPPAMPPRVADVFAKALEYDQRRLLPGGSAFMDANGGVVVAVYEAFGGTPVEARAKFWDWFERLAGMVRPEPGEPIDETKMPPGYQVHDDHEDPVYQAWVRPWSGPWRPDPDSTTKDAWDHLRGLAKPIVDEVRCEALHWEAKARRAGQYLTEVVNESNAAVEAARQRVYHRIACLLWPEGERDKTPDEVCARIMAIKGHHEAAVDLAEWRDWSAEWESGNDQQRRTALSRRITRALEADEWLEWALHHLPQAEANALHDHGAEDEEVRNAVERLLVGNYTNVTQAVQAARTQWIMEHGSTFKTVLEHVTGMLVTARQDAYIDGRRDAAATIRRALASYQEATKDSPLKDAPLLVQATMRAAARLVDYEPMSRDQAAATVDMALVVQDATKGADP